MRPGRDAAAGSPAVSGGRMNAPIWPFVSIGLLLAYILMVWQWRKALAKTLQLRAELQQANANVERLRSERDIFDEKYHNATDQLIAANHGNNCPDQLAAANAQLAQYREQVNRMSELAGELNRKTAEAVVLQSRLDQAQMQLAACLSAAEGWTPDNILQQGDFAWTLTYEKVTELRTLRDRLFIALSHAQECETAQPVQGAWLTEANQVLMQARGLKSQ
jgi:hypothetical protein